MTTEPVTITADPALLSAAVDLPGTAEGTLVGGNLTAVATSVGARLPDLDGAILLLEEPRTRGLGLIDRLLTQLIRSGALDGVRGVALGLFEDFPDLTDRGWRLVDVLQDRLGGLGVPVLGGLLVGHGGLGDDGAPDQFAVPLGTTATLDTTTGTLTAHPCVR
jgi:muramoyltetrapeptide carboxypeptidase